jgi:hypothetical protein
MCGVKRERGFGLSKGERGGRFLGLGRRGRFSRCGREIHGRKLEKRPPDCMVAEPSRRAWRLYAARRHEPTLLAAALGRRSWAAQKKKRARSGGPRATGLRGGKRGGAREEPSWAARGGNPVCLRRKNRWKKRKKEGRPGEKKRRLGRRAPSRPTTREKRGGKKARLGRAQGNRPKREGKGFSIYFSYFSHNSSLECMIHKPSQSNNKIHDPA